MVAAVTPVVIEQDTGSTIIGNSPYQYKEIIVTAPDTTDDGDTLDVQLNTYGITTLLFIKGYTHSTEGSIIIEETPTTVKSANGVMITVGGSTDNKYRAFIVGGI